MHSSTRSTISPRFLGLAVVCVLGGIILRWVGLAQNDFFFYDEGYYLNENRRAFVEFISRQPLHTPGELIRGIYANLQVVLGTGKALWLFLSNLRVFFGWKEAWYFPKILSALLGSLTVGLLYLFARRYFCCNKKALWSAMLLALVPSHVFYSRLAMQEACSTFLVLLGFYFYLFPRRLGWQTFLSGFIFMLAYFSSYRLIIIPLLTGLAELLVSLDERKLPDFRKYFWHALTFGSLVLLAGSIDQGQHWQVIVPWMFYQQSLAQHEPFQWFNLFSYPYYTFKLEGFFFGLFFWSNLRWLVRRQWKMALPFLLACLQMTLFSFAEDKAARYICVVYPFMAMAIATGIVALLEKFPDGDWRRPAARVAVGMLFCGMLLNSWLILQEHSDYRPAAEFLKRQNPGVKFVTSQKWVMDLYVTNPRNVEELPRYFPLLVQKQRQGFQYLVIDPQAYVSWTRDQKRFVPPLTDYLEFVRARIEPVKIFPHLNSPSQILLERFVFEHNSNFRQSLRFLELARREPLGEIRIYDLKQVVDTVFIFMSHSTQQIKATVQHD